jgi:hypothetical protein
MYFAFVRFPICNVHYISLAPCRTDTPTELKTRTATMSGRASVRFSQSEDIALPFAVRHALSSSNVHNLWVDLGDLMFRVRGIQHKGCHVRNQVCSLCCQPVANLFCCRCNESQLTYLTTTRTRCLRASGTGISSC